MRSQKPTSRDRSNEKGAALITAVLLSLLLLAAGGTLILTTTMSGITARDSTAEMQAYYAAEAGVARSLEVLKGNVESSPAGTRASFYNVLCSTNLWPTMTGANVNVAADGSSILIIRGLPILLMQTRSTTVSTLRTSPIVCESVSLDLVLLTRARTWRS
jgi:hypothetical protein